MKQTIGRAPAAIAVGVAFLLGVLIAWGAAYRLGKQELVGMALAHELGTIGLCANSLKLNAAKERDRLARVLEHRLDAAVSQASSLTDQGARLLGPLPHLRDSVRRAADYYATVGDTARQQRAEALLAVLEKKP